MNPFKFIDQNTEAILKTYHTLHNMAEPSWEEKKTSHYIAEHLKSAGLEVKSFKNHHGLIAEIPGSTDHVIAIRADMDALVQEVHGVVKPNHSCGHDGHSTMVLYTALALAVSDLQPKYTLRFIFQPAEETGEGALKMIEDGALENVSFLFGIHLRPAQEIPNLMASPVITHGSAATIRGTIKGLQAHASRPKDGINVIEVAASLVQNLQQIELQTDIPYSIKMTQLKTENESTNVIPETALFALDMRAQNNKVMSELEQLTKKVLDLTAEQTNSTIKWSLEEFVPAANTNQKAIELVKNAIINTLGKENFIPVCISPGGEDFHFYTYKNPGLIATMIGLGCGLTPGLHHPDMKFNINALIYGAKILIETVLLALLET